MKRTLHAEANTYLEDPEKYAAQAKAAMDHTARTNLEGILGTLSGNKCTAFEDCLVLSRKQFQSRFHDKIAQVRMHAIVNTCTCRRQLGRSGYTKYIRAHTMITESVYRAAHVHLPSGRAHEQRRTVLVAAEAVPKTSGVQSRGRGACVIHAGQRHPPRRDLQH